MLLSARDVHAYYGQVRALSGISIDVDQGEIVAVVGANGAGKTTLLKTLCGIVPCRSGQVLFENDTITNLATEDLVRRGISLVPDSREIFTEMSVWENLLLGTYAVRSKHANDERFELVYRLFPKLRDRRKQMAGTLSGGEQQMLAIGRALMSGPKLLLLDEPSNGLSPLLVRQLFGAIQELRKAGVTVLLVEQSVVMALSEADRGYVLQTGSVVLAGEAKGLLNRADLRDAYMGMAINQGGRTC